MVAGRSQPGCRDKENSWQIGGRIQSFPAVDAQAQAQDLGTLGQGDFDRLILFRMRATGTGGVKPAAQLVDDPTLQIGEAQHQIAHPPMFSQLCHKDQRPVRRFNRETARQRDCLGAGREIWDHAQRAPPIYLPVAQAVELLIGGITAFSAQRKVLHNPTAGRLCRHAPDRHLLSTCFNCGTRFHVLAGCFDIYVTCHDKSFGHARGRVCTEKRLRHEGVLR